MVCRLAALDRNYTGATSPTARPQGRSETTDQALNAAVRVSTYTTGEAGNMASRYWEDIGLESINSVAWKPDGGQEDRPSIVWMADRKLIGWICSGVADHPIWESQWVCSICITLMPVGQICSALFVCRSSSRPHIRSVPFPYWMVLFPGVLQSI